MGEENISQEFRLRNIDETRNYFVKETEQNELINLYSAIGLKIFAITAGIKKCKSIIKKRKKNQYC